jgi:hypothetical protein
MNHIPWAGHVIRTLTCSCEAPSEQKRACANENGIKRTQRHPFRLALVCMLHVLPLKHFCTLHHSWLIRRQVRQIVMIVPRQTERERERERERYIYKIKPLWYAHGGRSVGIVRLRTKGHGVQFGTPMVL